MAVIVGLLAGVASVVFRELINLFHNLFFYGKLSFTYDITKHAQPSKWGLGIILVPAIVTIFVTWLIKFEPVQRDQE